MSVRGEIGSHYARHGPAHFTPFIGDAYEDGRADAFRAMIVGINPYISDGDWKAPEEMRGWLEGFWGNAACGHGGTHPFFTKAFRETDRLARALCSSSNLFRHVEYDDSPQTKSGLYATNAVKVYLAAEYQDASRVTPELLEPYRTTWHAELNTLARRGVFPHLIVALGQQIWQHMWQAFDEHYFKQPEFSVLRYGTCGSDADPVYHHANRLLVKTARAEQDVLLVRFHHPAARGAEQRRAEWLLDQPAFRKLAEMASPMGT
jgi:hypothetical protein